MRSRRFAPWLVVALALAPLAGASCSSDDTNTHGGTSDGGPDGGKTPPAGEAGATPDGGTDASDAGSKPDGSVDPGALIHITFDSQVGVLLDEIPESIRERVATAMLAKPASFWIARAKRQLVLATYRLNFRPAFYDEADAKQQLPLPQEDLFDITPKKAQRTEVDGHDYVLVDYSLDTTVLTDFASPGISEPALADIGGTWDEPFVFPVDPELLVQRTGYACMDEAEFPPQSVDTEDVEFFYDQECDVELEASKTGCHNTKLALESCGAALTKHVGKVEAPLHYERIAWDAAKADAVRSGPVTTLTGSDLEVLHEELLVNRLTYRYIEADSCAVAESCVGGTGWRRLLQFNASEKNVGAVPLNIGNVDYFLDDPDNLTPNANHHLYEYSACHQHYHFSHYATFSYAGETDLGSKRAFCLESVARYSNNEHSPTHSPYNGCHYQGISEGWGDQYNAGIECQWVDVTTFDTSSGPITKPLGLVSNPDGFLCEGVPRFDPDGNTLWEPTEFKNADGLTVDRPQCDFLQDWDANNPTSLDITLPVPGEGMVTSECTRGQIGLLRNCGFEYDHAVVPCTAGKTTSVSCTVPGGSAPQVVRLCEASKALGAGVACTSDDALENAEVASGTATTVTFICPKARDATEPGGSYAVYTGPSFTEDEAAKVTCVVE
jgi:hypothetical protein